MAQGLLSQAGGQPQKQPRHTPIHVSRAMAGLITNRAALHDPSQYIVERFYGGQPDVLLDGGNIEISSALTWKHRPGNSIFGVSSSLYPSSPLTAYGFYNTSSNTISVFVDTSTGVYLHNASGAPTLIFAKSAGAGQTSFLQLGNILHFTNGVDSKKYINGTIYNWAGPGPTAAPTVTVNNIGSGAVSGVPWTASTTYTTMGLLEDPNGNVQQLVSVNADGSNTANATIGTSGLGEPVFATTSGGTVSEVRLTWECYGPIVAWKAATTYQDASTPGSSSAPCAIFDPGTKNIFIANVSGGGTGTSGASRPNFSQVPLKGSTARESGGVKWFNIGPATTWKPSFTYAQWGSGSGTNDSQSFVCSPTTPAAAGIGTATSPQTVFLQVQTQTANTSDGSHVGPRWSTSASSPITRDGQLSYTFLGSATWAASTSYTAWQSGASSFSVIYDGTNFQVCIKTGTSGSSTPSWETLYGKTTIEATGSGVQWVCVGSKLSWVASTKWYLPTGGFQPPVQGVNPYGGSNVLDSNGNAEFCTNSGLSAASHPAWPTAIGGTVTEAGSGPTWTCTALAAQITGGTALAFTKGYAYGYAFKSRSSTDFYVTNTPNGQPGALGAPTGAGTGGITTSSPIFQMATGSNSGAQIQVAGSWPTDLQYDTVCVFRCTDGFQGGPYFELTEIPVPAAVNGVVQDGWKFYDSIPDTALNQLIEADVVGLNDPPPMGLTNISFHMGRVWGNVGANVYASSGADILPDNGNGNEGFAPASVFPLKSPVNKLIPTQSGLMTFTTSDVYIIAGGPAITQFFPWIIAPAIGLLSPNSIIQLGGEFYMFTADQRFIAFMPGVGHTELGFNIADKLAAFNPANVYVTEHANGQDSSSIYIGDGSTGWFRLNPHQSPDGQAVWSPFATVTGGCQMLISLQTSPGVRTLLVGGTGTNKNILKRDLSTNLDNGTAYHGFFIVGSIVLTHAGQLAELAFVTMDFANQGNPEVSYLQNEISGTFAKFSGFHSDPPLVYGNTSGPSSYYSRRYDFKQTVSNTGLAPSPLMARHLQLRVDFPAENAAHELYGFCLNGALFAES